MVGTSYYMHNEEWKNERLDSTKAFLGVHPQKPMDLPLAF